MTNQDVLFDLYPMCHCVLDFNNDGSRFAVCSWPNSWIETWYSSRYHDERGIILTFLLVSSVVSDNNLWDIEHSLWYWTFLFLCWSYLNRLEKKNIKSDYPNSDVTLWSWREVLESVHPFLYVSRFTSHLLLLLIFAAGPGCWCV